MGQDRSAKPKAMLRRGLTGLHGAIKWGSALAVTWGAVQMAQAQTTWKLVVPWRPPQVSVDVPELFAQALRKELGEPVEVHAPVYDQQDDALRWSLESASTQPSLVLFSEELALMGKEDKAHPRHLSHYEPAMLIWQTRWCLYVAKDSPLQQSAALQAWLHNPVQTPVIAIPEAKGRLSIWVKGMEQRTGRKWQVQTYGLKGSIVEPLAQGNTVALSYCNRQRLHPDQTRIVAQSGPTPAVTLPQVPLFSDIGWLPMQKGWMAWMVPKAVPVVQRQRMEAALERVMRDPSVQSALAGTGHVVRALTAQEAKHTIASFARTWHGIDGILPQP